MLISEITDGRGQTRVVARIDADARLVNGADSVYALALEAARAGASLRQFIDKRGSARPSTSPPPMKRAG